MLLRVEQDINDKVGEKMRTLDNTIKYYELLMIYNDTSKYKHYNLPVGFHYEFYQNGDEYDWIDIHIESGEFTSIDLGMKYFHDFYDSFYGELNKRCLFIIDNKTGEKVGTATISLLKNKEFGCKAAVDWVAIKKSYQGKHLARPLISKFISVANELGHDKLILHTQTTTWLAAKLYLDFNFEPLNINEITGWRILKTLTNHPKLENLKVVSNDIIYDKRNIEIEKQLREIYNTDDFNYSVWYKNGLHNVYTYCNGKTYEYEYFEDKNKIRLEEVINKTYVR